MCPNAMSPGLSIRWLRVRVPSPSLKPLTILHPILPIRSTPSRAQACAITAYLIQQDRILDLRVTGQEKHFGEDLGRLRIVVSEGQKQPTAMLGVDGNQTQRLARHLMN